VAGRKPKSRRSPGEPDEFDLARAVERLAREYGWGPDYLDGVLTDEQLVAYLDAAAERMGIEADSRFTEAVEAVRIGYVIANDKRAYGSWRSRRRPKHAQRVMSGQALEAAVMSLARRNPEYVTVG
jgi:hypothetical protein